MKTLTTLSCLVALAAAENAAAQQPDAPALPAPGRWDASGQLALLNRNRSDLSRWDHWYSAPAVDGTAGRYWTPHLKTEFEIGAAGHGRIDGEQSAVSGSTVLFPRYREHRLQETTLGATAQYQFFENQWVHPFVGAGAEVVRERHTSGALPGQTLRLTTVAPGLILPALPAIDRVNWSVRPLVTGGFKFYVSPNAFVRTEVRAALSTDRGPLALQWRGGVGFDF
ncbi:MAG TPA: outer membrane beta-barrel protein [Vicinamibacterales bacterium]